MHKQKKWLKFFGALLFAIIIVTGVEYYFHYKSIHPHTEDAYLRAPFTKVATLIDGKVMTVNVANGEHVRKGQALFQLNKQLYLLALQAAKARLELAKRQFIADQRKILATKAELQKMTLEIKLLKREAQHADLLAKGHNLSKHDVDLAETKLEGAEKSRVALEEKLAGLEQLTGEVAKNSPLIKVAQAEYAKASFDLEHTNYYAPIQGIIENINLHKGDIVAAGHPLFVIVNPKHYWVEANYPEKTLSRIKPGQKATIHIDMYPSTVFHGVVQSIKHASQSSFSLLPAQNTTGNWVKVAQRFGVHIKLIGHTPKHTLRLGSSCSVTINTVNQHAD